MRATFMWPLITIHLFFSNGGFLICAADNDNDASVHKEDEAAQGPDSAEPAKNKRSMPETTWEDGSLRQDFGKSGGEIVDGFVGNTLDTILVQYDPQEPKDPVEPTQPIVDPPKPNVDPSQPPEGQETTIDDGEGESSTEGKEQETKGQPTSNKTTATPEPGSQSNATSMTASPGPGNNGASEYCDSTKFEYKHYLIPGAVGLFFFLGTALLIGAICNICDYCNAKGAALEATTAKKQQSKKPTPKDVGASSSKKPKQPIPQPPQKGEGKKK